MESVPPPSTQTSVLLSCQAKGLLHPAVHTAELQGHFAHPNENGLSDTEVKISFPAFPAKCLSPVHHFVSLSHRHGAEEKKI